MLAASALLLSLLAVPALAVDIPVVVGGNGLIFEPEQVTAAVGDTITFSFVGTHSATLSSLETPCEAATANAFNAFAPSPATYTVSDTEPKWFFCAVGTHCQMGQVFAINPPAGQFAVFQARAQGQEAPAASPGMSSMASMSSSAAAASGSMMSSVAAASGSMMSSMMSGSASRAASSAVLGASAVASSGGAAVSAAASSAAPGSAGFVAAGLPSTQLAVAGLVGAAAMLLI